ncbi:MAG: peptide deformylase [Candidatus Eremiobacteraeota bacterium]|nr:peptide deformylase [Candidatus Eremiobacteraeota bacterium]
MTPRGGASYRAGMPYAREILLDGHPTLRKVAKKVDPKEIAEPLFQQLIDDMFETMYAAPGVGLAAPQVNVSKRVFVIDVRDDEREPAVVINPKIESAEEEVELTEGCLSVPGMIGEIVRFKRVAVSGLDRDGNKIRLEGDGLFAQCLQHEIGHLNGELYIDKARNVRPAITEEEAEAAEGGVPEAADAVPQAH